jgi:hypothetical protein
VIFDQPFDNGKKRKISKNAVAGCWIYRCAHTIQNPL